ncbi:MAG: hypothetical protein Q9208_004958 [Pyrenodesmia sp. 3 TL-2023]
MPENTDEPPSRFRQGSSEVVPLSTRPALPAEEAVHVAAAESLKQIRDNTSLRRQTLPPPPKAGEKLRAQDFYTLKQGAPMQKRQSYHRHTHSTQAASRPWSVTGPLEVGGSEQPVATRTRAKSMAEGTLEGNIEHPPMAPCYVQDPYALEMTAEQRFATEQEDHDEQGLPLPINTHRRGPSTASIEEIWKIARRNTEGIIDGIQEWLANPRKTF